MSLPDVHTARYGRAMAQPTASFPSSVQLTRDMAETLVTHFASFEADGVVTIEFKGGGLWLVHASGFRQFLGSTKRLDRGEVPEPSLH